MVRDYPFLFVAQVALNLLEISPRPEHLPFLVGAVQSLLDAHADDTGFWVDFSMGSRVCNMIEVIVGQDETVANAESDIRPALDLLLARLVALGVAEASQLEKTLAAR